VEGNIKLRVQTRGYGGHKYNRAIQITTNDPENPDIRIRVTGDIQKFVTMTPSAVFLTGKEGEAIAAIVKIFPETEPAFQLMQVNAMNGNDIRYSVTEKEEQGRKFYELLVENAAEAPGRYYDRIVLITDRSDQAPLIVNIRGNILPKEGPPPGSQPAGSGLIMLPTTDAQTK
jgi:hypothetical protein